MHVGIAYLPQDMTLETREVANICLQGVQAESERQMFG